jgi:hypothetical protein
MKSSRARSFVLLGMLLMLFASCAGFGASLAFRDPKTPIEFRIFTAVATVGGLLGAAFFFLQARRESVRKAQVGWATLDSAPLYHCPLCLSTSIVRLPKNDISPLPGYQCEECRVVLTAPGTKVIYAAVCLLAVGMLALSAWQVVDSNGMSIRAWGIGVIALTVLGFSIRQMWQPSLRRGGPEGTQQEELPREPQAGPWAGQRREPKGGQEGVPTREPQTKPWSTGGRGSKGKRQPDNDW